MEFSKDWRIKPKGLAAFSPVPLNEVPDCDALQDQHWVYVRVAQAGGLAFREGMRLSA